MEKPKFAVIGGTGFEKLFRDAQSLKVKTPYGMVSSLFDCRINRKKALFLSRHGSNHSVPPHMVNYRANIYTLYKKGIERIVATNAVGALNLDFKPGDVVIPHDFVDFTKRRLSTFYDDPPVTHIDVSQPYCPELRKLLIEHARDSDLQVWDKSVIVCTEGPRYETPAEIEVFRRMGCDIVGMTGFPEVVLARELEICYASLCYVSNMAAGMQQKLTAFEVAVISKQILPKIEQTLIKTLKSLPLKRNHTCPCINALSYARFK